MLWGNFCLICPLDAHNWLILSDSPVTTLWAWYSSPPCILELSWLWHKQLHCPVAPFHNKGTSEEPWGWGTEEHPSLETFPGRCTRTNISYWLDAATDWSQFYKNSFITKWPQIRDVSLLHFYNGSGWSGVKKKTTLFVDNKTSLFTPLTLSLAPAGTTARNFFTTHNFSSVPCWACWIVYIINSFILHEKYSWTNI